MQLIKQRKASDCGVAALAMIAEIAYEDAYVAVAQVDPKYRGGKGLMNKDVIAAGHKLGVVLVSTHKFDLDEDEGILKIFLPQSAHWVAVHNAEILCPTDGVQYPWQDYLDRYRAKAVTLLKLC